MGWGWGVEKRDELKPRKGIKNRNMLRAVDGGCCPVFSLWPELQRGVKARDWGRVLRERREMACRCCCGC